MGDQNEGPGVLEDQPGLIPDITNENGPETENQMLLNNRDQEAEEEGRNVNNPD